MMFTQIFKSAIYSLVHFRAFSLVNIFGLSMGLTAFLLIMLYVMNEHGYDAHWKDADRLYHIQKVTRYGGQEAEREAQVSHLLLPALQSYFQDEIEITSRRAVAGMTGISATGGSEPQTVGISYVEPSFFEMFQFQSLQGDLQAVFDDSNSIALSRETATRLFGDDNPVGRTVNAKFFYADDNRDYRVAAVYTLEEGNTVLSLPALALYDEDGLFGESPQWWESSVETFIKVSASADVEDMQAQMPDFIDSMGVLPDDLTEVLPPDTMPSALLSYELIALEDIFLGNLSLPSAPDKQGNPLLVSLFTLIAVLVLLVGCANYSILSLAVVAGRQREFVMRKVLGASRLKLALHFVAESLLITLIALTIALSVQEIVLPIFENFLGKDLVTSTMDIEISVLAGILLLVVTVVNGAVPALILARKQPATTLKANQSTATTGNIHLKNIFLVFQFSVAIGLMVVTAVVFLQLHYMEGLDPGYDPENLIVVNTGDPVLRNSQQVLLDEIRSLPQVENATSSGLSAGTDQGLSLGAPYEIPGQLPEEAIHLPTLTVGHEFFRTFDISLIDGRVFERDRDPSEPMVPFEPPTEEAMKFTGGKLVLNRSATEELGFASPHAAIGQTVNSMALVVDERRPFTVIGVVENNRFRSLRERPEPQVYRLSPEAAFSVTLRYQGNPDSVVTKLSDVWDELAGDIPLKYSFVGDEMAQVFNSERRQGRLFLMFSLLTILIACLGLFAMAVYTAQSRTKEIGIRKVFGAEVGEIVWLLIRQISQPVFLASLIVWPVVLWVMNSWLQKFPYQVDFVLVLLTALLASCLSIICAWITVGITATKAASTKPVSSLRYE